MWLMPCLKLQVHSGECTSLCLGSTHTLILGPAKVFICVSSMSLMNLVTGVIAEKPLGLFISHCLASC